MRIVSPANIPRDAKVYIHATDTCYGFAARWNDVHAIRYIQELKQRPISQPVSLLFKDIFMIQQFAELSDAQSYFFTHQTEPVSGIIFKKPALKKYFPDFETVSCRIETDHFPLKLSSILGMPVTSTSVNITSKNELYDPQIIQHVFSETSDDVVLIDSGILKPTPPSVIWDLTQINYKQMR